jgi:hypothetical protein
MVRLRKFGWVIPALFFLLNLILRAIGIEVNSLAGDEPFSVYFAQMDVSHILRHLRPGNNPPLYELFLHYWVNLFGISELSARIPSLIFVSITAAYIYKIGNEFFTQSSGIVAGLLFSFSNYATCFSHEARAYALFGLFTAISFYLFLRWLNDRTSAKMLVIYALVNALLLYTHYFGVMVIGLQILLAILFSYADLHKLKRFMLPLVLSLFLFSPYVPIVIEQFSVTRQKGTWLVSPTGWNTIAYVLAQFTNTSGVVKFALAVLGLSILVNIRNWRRVDPNIIVIIAWFAVPFIGMYIVSFWVPMFHDRYLMHTVGGFMLLLAAGSLSVFSIPVVKWMFPALLVLVMGATSSRNIDNGRHTKEAVALVQELRDSNTRVVMYPKYRIFGYAYYFNKERFQDYDSEYGYYKVLEGFKEENLYGINQYSEARIDSTVKKVIFMMTDGGPKDQLLDDFEQEFELTKKYFFPEIIDVYEFHRDQRESKED